VIIEFRVKNHRSFREEQVLSFGASNYDKSLPANLIDPGLPGLPDDRFVRAVAIYGPNAGGKTNVLLALRFLKWLVTESAAGQKPEAALPTDPFRLDDLSRAEPTHLELTFVVDEVRFQLAVAVTRERIVQERLVAFPSGRAQIWYDRVWNGESAAYEWSPERPTDFVRDAGIVEKTRANALFLSTAAQWNNLKLAPVYQWFSEKLEFLSLGAGAYFSHNTTAQLINGSGPQQAIIARLLQAADLGLTDVEARHESPDGEALKFVGVMREAFTRMGAPQSALPDRMWQVTFQHTGRDGKVYPIDWGEQSSGTRRFFSVLGPWLTAFGQGRILCVDEMDTSLHPVLAMELLRLLFREAGPEHRSQLIFTTHNPLLLDLTLLRRDQIWFADKNPQGETFLYPLTDYRPRADESLVRGYMSGRYGAIPFIPNGLAPELATAPYSQPKEVPHAG